MLSTPELRHSGAFADSRSRNSYWITLGALVLLGILLAIGLVSYDNPLPFGHKVFWVVADRRLTSVITMLLVAVCQGLATVAFQTVTHNRIITPSIMGFESLYVLINTSLVFFFGVSGALSTSNLMVFLAQMGLMILLSLVLYSWLLAGTHNLHAMLLVGIVIGGGLGSLSTFLQRMLTPSEFDVLTARLFGSVNNASKEFFPVAIPMIVLAAIAVLLLSTRLNVLALGRDATNNLGVNHKMLAIGTLVCVSVLMAVSTALVGPMTFLGFLVATLAYQFANTYDHRYIFPLAVAIGFAVLTGAYFIMNHIFYAQGVVSIIIELVGGSAFLYVILRKGRL